jgi:hypothetical protein
LDSERNDIVTAASIRMRAEIASYGYNALKGILYSQYLDRPFGFISLMQMIEKMEEIFDTKGFPEAFMTPRTFGYSGKNTNKHKIDGNEVMKDETASGIVFEPGDTKCTFEITVKFRQNATWQGQILWAEKNLKQNFRSVLEMLRLMDEALTENTGKPEQVKWEEM